MMIDVGVKEKEEEASNFIVRVHRARRKNNNPGLGRGALGTDGHNALILSERTCHPEFDISRWFSTHICIVSCHSISRRHYPKFYPKIKTEVYKSTTDISIGVCARMGRYVSPPISVG